MTRKDFNEIAFALRSAVSPDPDSYATAAALAAAHEVRSYIAHSLATYCARRNPRFDRARFLAACGVNVNEPVRA